MKLIENVQLVKNIVLDDCQKMSISPVFSDIELHPFVEFIGGT